MLTIIIIKRFYFNFNLARGTFAAGRNNFAVRCFSSLDCVLPVTVRYPLRNDRFIDIISGKRISQILKRIYSIILTLCKSKGIPCPFSNSTPEVIAKRTCRYTAGDNYNCEDSGNTQRFHCTAEMARLCLHNFIFRRIEAV